MTLSLKELVARGGKIGAARKLVKLMPSTGPKKKNKYGNEPTWVGEIRFASKKEAARYCDLKLLESAGEIRDLKLQERFELVVNGVRVCAYQGDFSYVERYRVRGQWAERAIVEDTKGKRTREFLIKKNLMRGCLGIEVRET